MTNDRWKLSPFRRRVTEGSLALLLCLGAGGWSPLSISQEKAQPQEQKQEEKKGQEPFKIGVEVNLVTVPVTVRKPAGGFVKGLPQSAFQILEDGEPQEILYFAQEGVPARIAITLDTSGSVRYEWGSIKYATKKFIEHLTPEDKIALVNFDEQPRIKMARGNSFSRVISILSLVSPIA